MVVTRSKLIFISYSNLKSSIAYCFSFWRLISDSSIFCIHRSVDIIIYWAFSGEILNSANQTNRWSNSRDEKLLHTNQWILHFFFVRSSSQTIWPNHTLMCDESLWKLNEWRRHFFSTEIFVQHTPLFIVLIANWINILNIKLKIQIEIGIAFEFWLRRIILRRFWTYSLMKCFFRNISICSISNLMKTYFSYLLMIIMSSTYFPLVRNEQTATSAIINRSPTRHLHDTD